MKMRTGINLASRPNRAADASPVVKWIPFVGLLALTALHVYFASGAERRLAERRADVARKEAALERLVQEENRARVALARDTRQRALQELLAFELAGVRDGVQTSGVLSEVARALPRDARALAITLHVENTRPQMSLDVESADPEAASEFALALSRSSVLENSELVDERAIEDGGYRVRVTADVRRKGASK